MSNETHESSFLIFDRNMANVAPIHNTGGKIDQVIRTQREKIGSHELSHSLIALIPISVFARFNNRPCMHRFALLLPLKHSRGEHSITHVFRSGPFGG